MNVPWFVIFFAVLLWSAVHPKDCLTWFLEVFPALAALVVLVATRRRFPLTRLSYGLILIHSIILMVGGHYTYAEVPLFNWIRDVFEMGRNNYDKVGHLAQGFVPAVVIREIIIRLRLVSGRGWTHFFVVATCLAVSAFYELIEWWVALLEGASSEAFLGTQGYVWDTQSDMAMALVGAVMALALLGRIHDRQLAALPGSVVEKPSP